MIFVFRLFFSIKLDLRINSSVSVRILIPQTVLSSNKALYSKMAFFSTIEGIALLIHDQSDKGRM